MRGKTRILADVLGLIALGDDAYAPHRLNVGGEAHDTVTTPQAGRLQALSSSSYPPKALSSSSHPRGASSSSYPPRASSSHPPGALSIAHQPGASGAVSHPTSRQPTHHWPFWEEELRAIEERRNGFKITAPGVNGLVGLALSGGGLRSATYCMGVLQVLSDAGLYREIDYLSTVSGGGFAGALISTFPASVAPPTSPTDAERTTLAEGPFRSPMPLAPQARSDAASPPPHQAATGSGGAAPTVPSAVPSGMETHSDRGDASPPAIGGCNTRTGEAVSSKTSQATHEPGCIRHVRNRSRYLVAGELLDLLRTSAIPIVLGIGGALSAAACVVATGALCIHALLWLLRIPSAVLIIACLLGVLLLLFAICLSRGRLPPLVGAGVFFSTLGALGFSALVVGLGHALIATRHALNGGVLENVPAEAFFAALPFLLTGIGALARRRRDLVGLARLLLYASPTAAFLIGVSGLHSWVEASPRPLAHVFEGWLANAPPALVEVLGSLAIELEGPWENLTTLCSLTFVIALLVDVNQFSPRLHYAIRLRRAFCQAHQTPLEGRASTRLEDLSNYAPLHLINATANLPSSRALELRGRRCRPFVFSKFGWMYPASGGEGELEDALTAHNRLTRSVDLASAIAISGAAVSSWLGTQTLGGATPWLTLLNLRLGYWAPNPAKPFAWLALPSGYYLFKELLGRASENAWRLNLTDGGHFENLGVYELIRRRCRYIVAIDGEADPDLQFGGLNRLIELARIDFGAEVRLDVGSLRLREDESQLSNRHFSLGEVRYVDGTVGWLLYIKLSVTGDEPAYVLSYRRKHADFPHESTADQSFDEEQFEAYRALGEHVGRTLFRPDLVGAPMARAASERIAGGQQPVALADWFSALESSLVYRRAFEEAQSGNGAGNSATRRRD